MDTGNSSISTSADIDSVEKLECLRISSLDDVIEEKEEDDYDDEEGGGGREVILGLVEKPKKPWPLLLQHFPSKARGAPAWLIPIDLPSGRSALCDMCEQPLQFLLQDDVDALDRATIVCLHLRSLL